MKMEKDFFKSSYKFLNKTKVWLFVTNFDVGIYKI